jgi:hypothetical protein
MGWFNWRLRFVCVETESCVHRSSVRPIRPQRQAQALRFCRARSRGPENRSRFHSAIFDIPASIAPTRMSRQSPVTWAYRWGLTSEKSNWNHH